MTLATAPAANPQIWYKNQRVLRSLLQALIGAVPVAVAILGILSKAWPAEWLTAALAVSVSFQTVLTKVMANDLVNAWLIRWTIFGSVPRNTNLEDVAR